MYQLGYWGKNTKKLIHRYNVFHIIQKGTLHSWIRKKLKLPILRDQYKNLRIKNVNGSDKFVATSNLSI